MDVANSIDSKKKRPARRKHLHITTRAYLCKLVRDRPVLWKRSHPQYKRNSARNVAWEEISNVMSMSVKDVKGYWASFREQYRYNSGKLKKNVADSDEEQDNVNLQIDDESECLDQEELQQWDLWEHYRFMVEENCPQNSTSLTSQRPCNKCRQVEPMESASSESNAPASDVNSGAVDDSASSCGYNDINSILDVTLACDDDETGRCNSSKRANGTQQRTTRPTTPEYSTTPVYTANRPITPEYSTNRPKTPEYSRTDYQVVRKPLQSNDTRDMSIAVMNTAKTFNGCMQHRKQHRQANGYSQHSALFYALGFIETQLEKLSELKQQELLQKFMHMCFEAIKQQNNQ